MESNNKTAVPLLLFPYQMAEVEELNNCFDIGVLYFQYRLIVTDLINYVNNGNREPRDKECKIVDDFNDFAREWGRQELHF